LQSLPLATIGLRIFFPLLALLVPNRNGKELEKRLVTSATIVGTWNDSALVTDALHLSQCNLFLCPVVELRCSWRLVYGHLLGVLEPSVVLQANRDAGWPPGVTSNWVEKARRLD